MGHHGPLRNFKDPTSFLLCLSKSCFAELAARAIAVVFVCFFFLIIALYTYMRIFVNCFSAANVNLNWTSTIYCNFLPRQNLLNKFSIHVKDRAYLFSWLVDSRS